MSNAKHYVMASALVVVMITGSTSFASAHGLMACYYAGADFCKAAHAPGTAALKACLDSVKAGCVGHNHPGSSVPPPPDPNFTADPGRQFYKKNKGLRFRQR